MTTTTKFDLNLPLHSIFPKSWKPTLGACDYAEFRNLNHFKYVMSSITQKEGNKCGVSYADALHDMVKGVAAFPIDEQISIRNLVRENLHRRGLITAEVYENFRYTVDGINMDVDVGKFVNNEAECVLSPAVQYVDFFYELYISVSYPYRTENSTIRENVAKLLATIEELERQHIFIKIVLVFPSRQINRAGATFFSTVPVFSHKEVKTVDILSSVINDRLLRKFFFALVEDIYQENLSSNYGYTIELEDCMNIGHTFDEVDFFKGIVKSVGA